MIFIKWIAAECASTAAFAASPHRQSDQLLGSVGVGPFVPARHTTTANVVSPAAAQSVQHEPGVGGSPKYSLRACVQPDWRWRRAVPASAIGNASAIASRL
eukprot:2732413-Prymnesium_polylepis.1